MFSFAKQWQNSKNGSHGARDERCLVVWRFWECMLWESLSSSLLITHLREISLTHTFSSFHLHISDIIERNVTARERESERVGERAENVWLMSDFVYPTSNRFDIFSAKEPLIFDSATKSPVLNHFSDLPSIYRPAFINIIGLYYERKLMTYLQILAWFLSNFPLTTCICVCMEREIERERMRSRECIWFVRMCWSYTLHISEKTYNLIFYQPSHFRFFFCITIINSPICFFK